MQRKRIFSFSFSDMALFVPAGDVRWKPAALSIRLSSVKPNLIRFLLVASLLSVTLFATGCRRNLMRISSSPSNAVVFVEGQLVRVEDGDRVATRRIETKKTRGRTLSEEEAEFDKKGKLAQGTPLEYEFESIACGYGMRCQKPGYEPEYQVYFVKPRWYEYPPLDFFVDLLPFTVTDTREVHFNLEPKSP